MNFRSKVLLFGIFIIAVSSSLSATQFTVTVQNFSFNPANITISHGDTVVWHCTSGFHNIHHTTAPSLFSSTAATAPWNYSVVFDHFGDSVFHYECEIHPSLMQGTVTVNPASVPKPQPKPFIAEAIILEPNYPNPFNATTMIAFDLVRSENVSLTVYDLLGQKSFELWNGFTVAGRHQVTFNGGNLATGVYIAKLTAGNVTQTQKLLLLR
jgi:plastocyanin